MSEGQPVELDAGTPEIDLSAVKHRSVTGVVALTTRSILIQIISFAATLILTIYLSPEVYGTFFLVSAVISFLTYFSDIGLAAALIQKKTAVTRTDLVTTFTVQQLLVSFILLLMFVFTPQIRSYYGLSSAAVYLLWALGISFLFSSLKTIPTILLERDLKFNRLVIPQILENLVFNLVAVYLAVKGWGINTFTIAVLLRGVVGLVAMYLISPWRPGLGFSKQSLKELLRFGLPFQLNTFLAVIKDDGMTLLLGKLIGQIGLGYIGWASKWAFLPLRFFMDNVTKVAFPAYSRLQHDPAALKAGVERTLFYLTLISFPIFVGMGMLAEPLVHLVPRYLKWQPALLPLYLYLINAAWSTISTPLTNALSAVGRINTTLKFMIMWTVLTWVLMPLLSLRFGYLGVAISAALIASTSLVVIYHFRSVVSVNWLKTLGSPLAGSLVIGLALYFTRPWFTSLYYLPLYIVAAASLYAAVVILLEGPKVVTSTWSLFTRRHA